MTAWAAGLNNNPSFATGGCVVWEHFIKPQLAAVGHNPTVV
jgi:hypothetical protein